MFVPPGYANISWIGRHLGTSQEAITSLGVLLEAADPGTVLAGAADAWADNLAPVIGADWQGEAVRISIGTSNPSAPIVGELDDFVFGSNTGDTAPPQVAWLVRKLTATGGRKGKGRMYIVGPGEDGIDSAGNFSTTQHADNQSRISAFQGDMEAIDGVAGLFLFHTLEEDDPSEILGLTAVRMVATQRRRLRG